MIRTILTAAALTLAFAIATVHAESNETVAQAPKADSQASSRVKTSDKHAKAMLAFIKG